MRVHTRTLMLTMEGGRGTDRRQGIHSMESDISSCPNLLFNCPHSMLANIGLESVAFAQSQLMSENRLSVWII